MAATENKQPVTGAGPLNGVLTWVDQRFPLMSMWRDHISEYYAPKNFNFWYYFGSLAMFVLVLQIVTGIFLTMSSKPSAADAFASVEYIMRDVEWGWLIRYLHSTGASAFFIVVYLHMFRAMLYGSYREPRELVWIFGVLIYLTLMGEAFFGYLLPWGQMSYWGAQVIVNLFGTVPFIGPDLSLWIRGDYVVSDATLNRFFSFHVIAVPLVLDTVAGRISFVSTVTIFGTPVDITLSELAIEAFFPADAAPLGLVGEEVSRRRLEVYAGNVFPTSLGSRFSANGTELTSHAILGWQAERGVAAARADNPAAARAACQPPK